MMVKLTGEDDPVKLHDIGAVPRRTTLDLKLKPPASKPLPVKNGALGTGFTLIPLPGNVRLIELHDLMVRERLPAKLKNKEFKIILSESLFDPGDIPALESVLGDGIEIKKPSLVRNDASNVKMPEGAVGCIISKEDYAGYWSESNRANNRSTILVLDVATEDDRALTYIYIEALMSLIYAMRMRDAEKVMRYAKSLFGMDDASAEEELAEFLKDEGAYRPAISKALKLLPIEELDTTRFYSYKDNTSKLLENA
jgi:hypothetical protein